MARPIEVPVVVKKGSLSRSIEGEATAAMHKLGRSSGAVAPLGRMLGKIRADADEFTKSIEASNARVIAFGASVGVINGISNAFKSLIATTVKVEKSMADINIVLGASQSNLAKFGDGLFKVAKNTAQSFDVVAEAATEFARQGLSIEETLKRTNDALILTRLTGLKAAESVKGLTAAVNGFGKAGLTTTQIINKLSAVDVKFAVGTDDLIDALSRAGAVAQDAGVSFDELVALVTVAQQRTARGGAVIGNAFKTIYTRIQDPKALNALRSVGIAVDDIAGAALPANKILQNLAQSYDSLGRSQKASVDQFVAGKFQINILKSVLGDLSTVNNEYSRAQQVSANATDQAIQKNQQLNKTLAALATQGGVAIEELAKKVGDISLGPGMRNIITTFNELVEGMTRGLDGEGTGATFAKGLLKGVGGILTGPGLILIGGVFIKLFKDLSIFGVKSLKNLLGLNNASKQQAALQQGIGQLLATNLKFQQAIAAAEGNTAKQAAITSRFLAQEVAMRERAAAATSRMAAGAYAGGFGVSSAGMITRGARRRGAPSFAPTGGIPNFASIKDYIKDGVFNVGQMPEVMTGSTAQFGKQTDGRMPIDTFFKQAKLGSERKGFTKAGAELRRVLDAHGVTHVQGHVRANNMPYSNPKGALSFYDQAFNVGPAREIGVYSDVGTRQTRSLADVGRQMMIDNPTKYGMSPTDAFMDAVKRHKASILASGISEPQLRSFYTGSGGSFEKAVFAADSNLKPYGHANFMFDAARDMGGGKFRQMDVKSRLNVTQFASLLAKKVRTMDLDEVPLMNIEKDRKHFQGQAQKRGTFENIMSKVKGFKFGRFIRNFAPLGDAIQREKMQVGAMMGISPSSVQTRVVQNTALKSPFNPQGFGVISPTVGQHSFADAQRMHRGEDLRTTNLPNFSIGDGGSRMDPFTGKMTHASVVDPGGTAKGTLSVKVEDYSDKALKKSEGALERRSRLERGTSLLGMTGKAGDVAKPPGALTRGYRSLVSGMGALGTGLQGAGGRAMGPAFTAMMLGEMAQGFVPAPATQDRLTMSGAQRRQAGASAKGIDYATKAATGLTALAAATPPITPHSALLKGGLVLAGTATAYMTGKSVGGDATLNIDERGALVEKRQQQRQSDQALGDAARQALVAASQQRGNPSQYKSTLSKGREALKDIQDPRLRSDLTKAFNDAESTGQLAAGVRKMGEAQTTHSPRIGAGVASARGGQALATIASHEALSKTQMEQVAGALAGLSESELTSVDQFLRGTSVNMPDLLGMGISKEGQAELFDQLKKKGFLKGGIRHPETGKGTSPLGKMVMKYRAPSTALGQVGGPPGVNLQPEFDAMRLRLLQSRGADARFQAREAGAAQVRGIAQGARLDVRSRIGGARATAQTRYLDALNEQRLSAENNRRGLAADMAGTFGGLAIDANPKNQAFMKAMTDALAGGDLGAARKIMSDVKFGEGGRISFKGQDLDIMDNNKNLEKFAENLENSAKLLDINSQAQLDYIEAQKKTADIMQKNGVLIAGIEGFRNSIQEALMSIANPSLGGGDIARNFAMGILGSINQQASSNVADYLGGKLGNFFGIESQRGAFVPGSGTGDKVPAMLESKEYVLNRNAVAAVGKENLDAINFGMFPRFQTGGGVFGGVSSRHRKKALEKFRYESLGPTSGGSVLGGGGIGLNLGVFDENLSSIAMNDPMAQATRGFLRQERQKDIQKQFAKQAKRDQLTQAVVGTAISVGLNAAVNKLGSKPDYGDVSGDPPEGFVPPDMAGYGPDGYPAGPAGYPAGPAGPVGFGGSQAGASKRFGMLGPLNPPQTPNNIYTRLADRVAAGATLTQAMKGEGLPTAGHQGANPQKTGTGVPGMSQQIRNQITANRGITPQSRKYGRVSRSDQLKLQVDALRQLGGAGQQVTPFPEMVGDAARSGLSTVGKAFSMIGKAPAMLGSAMSKGLSALMGGHRSMYDQLNPMIIDGDSNSTTRAFDEVYSTDQGYIGEIDGKFYIMQQHKSGKYGRYPSPLLMNRSTLMKSLNGKKIPGYQRGGSVDNIPAMLTGGEFVVNAGAVKRYGSNTLQHMNRGGMVGNQKFVPGDQNGSAKSNGEAGTSNTNNTVSISVNMGANGSPSISEDASGSTQDSARGARDLGRKIRDAVRSVIDEEKRVGGSLRNPYAREQ
jgi:TP901 family phage tail tape measure protein